MNSLTPRQIEALAKCIEYQEVAQHQPEWLGFTWGDVKVAAGTLNTLVTEGYLDISYQSRKYTNYKVADLDAAKSVMGEGEPVQQAYDPFSPLELPKDLFDVVVGHQQTRNIALMALQATDPVHVLFVGEPATAKSLFLSEVARLPHSRFMLGGNSTRAGITDFLLDVRPRVLAIDEIEKANQNDIDVLLSLMEDGKVTRLKHQMREEVTLRTWVFAGANSDKYLSPALKSRFISRHFNPYSQVEFNQVARSILTSREHIDPVWADDIVNGLQGKTLNVRDAVKVARMVQARSQIQEIIDAIYA